ncbi:hypothetical protein [Mesonia sp. K7]|uniref:hypothetical protein n=1 Tax=Mesonia sp. K7 TaxID=2218606 RepID=UPI000DA89666|nr:hypothetical protein [Mesonia sp. K7]PZD79206.1 hypothetical protein DNG35_01580 [Mesonia sp. K7]
MKINSLLGILFSLSAFGFCQAQLDSNTLPSGTLGGSTMNTGGFARSTPGLTQKKSNLFLETTEDAKLEGSANEMSIREDEEFLDPHKKFTPKYLAKKEGEKGRGEKYQKNQDFGEFRNNGKFVKITCRDHMAVDGDLVQVIVNGKVQVAQIFLDATYKVVNVFLEEGFNKIEIKALNQGESGPNTAEFKVYDDQGNMISQNVWNLATGYKASLMVIKEGEN